MIFERTGKVAKTHKGVDIQFHKLVKAEPGLAPDLAGELSSAYRYKQIADYDTGPAQPITQTEACDAIASAEKFVAAIRRVLTPPPASVAP